MERSPAKIYTQSEVESALNRSRMIGWIQGGAVTLGGLFLLKALGWIPVVLVTGLVGYGIYRLFRTQ